MGANKGIELRKAACPLCDNFSSKRLTSFEKHLSDAHQTTTQDLWDRLNNGPKLCACNCGHGVAWRGWWNGYARFVLGHSSTLSTGAFTEEEVADIKLRRSNSLKGKISWAKGLTKDTDDRVKRRGESTSVGRSLAFKEGRIKLWSKGLTKDTDARVAAAAKNLKDKFTSGEAVPWAKGLTTETDSRIAAMAQQVSLSMRQEHIRDRLDKMKLLPQEEVRSRVESSGHLRVTGGLEAYSHADHRVLEVQCMSCDAKFIGSLLSLQSGRCFKCAPGGSNAQEELAKWIETLGVAVHRNTRKILKNGMELDIYVEGKHVGIEYNGLYWHSHASKSSAYHNNKTRLAADADVKLIHVFEDEWRDKRDIVKSIVMSKLGLSSSSIGARKCTVRQLSSSERKTFFEVNHVDGDVLATAAWGLISPNGEIVYAMSVRRPFHKKESTTEVARCCPRLNHNVPGGLSRLIKTAKSWARDNGHKKIMTYVDTRLGGTGSGYVTAGFREISKTTPRFWWTDFDNRFNRFKYRADKSKGLTEAQVAESAKVVKIWGCENIVYELDIC